ncbi:MAG: hypothetical protein RJA45_531 [Actinomycetota bacterium]
MSFADAIKSLFANYANFKGRARRSEFWYSTLFVGAVGIVLNIVMPGQLVDFGGGILVQSTGLLAQLWSLATLVPVLAVVWRRLHDTNTGGPYYFMVLIPLVGPILVLIKLATEGTAGPNKFGNPVK